VAQSSLQKNDRLTHVERVVEENLARAFAVVRDTDIGAREA
jgi:hypothetical protein